ncbi:MAG: beta strand repeat-containing protein [Pirellulaceae bacterium]
MSPFNKYRNKVKRKRSDTAQPRTAKLDTLSFEGLEQRRLLAHSPFPLSQLPAGGGADGFLISGPENLGNGGLTGGGIGTANLGDINGDNISDLLVGSPGSNSAYVIYGNAGGFSSQLNVTDLNGANGFTLTGLTTTAGSEFFGVAVSAAGDVNGDGLNDFVIGDPGADAGDNGSVEGAAYVIFGRGPTSTVATLQNPLPPTLNVGTLDGTTGYIINGAIAALGGAPAAGSFGFAAPAGVGMSVSGGDISGDGTPDLLLGAPDVDVAGPAAGMQKGTAWVVLGERLAALDAADGTTDGAITLSNANLITGANVNAYRLDGINAGSQFGFSTAVGNLDGAGGQDLIIGAFNDNPDADATVEGAAYVIFGSNLSGLDTAGGTVAANGIISLSVGPAGNFLGTSGAVPNSNYAISDFVGAPTAQFGYSVAAVADINGDGTSEIAVGAPFDAVLEGALNTGGIAFLLFGNQLANIDAADGTSDGSIDAFANRSASTHYIFATFAGGPGAVETGISVADAGDVSGDGTPDLIIGSQFYNTTAGGPQGAAFVVFGESLVAADNAAGTANNQIIRLDGAGVTGTNQFQIDGFQMASQVGNTVSSVGDINMDGRADLIVGAILANPDADATTEGAAYVVYGPATIGPSNTATGAPATMDFGDAPDISAGVGTGDYQTLAANGGPSHTLGSGLRLGANVDAESDGQPNSTATGDDIIGVNDDDGIVFVGAATSGPPTWAPGQTVNIVVNVSAASMLDAFVDYSAGGVFGPGEQLFGGSQPLVAGNNNLSFTVPVTATQGLTIARFRVSTAGALGPNGAAADGEVEDYQVNIGTLDFGDAPDSYGTLAASGGPSHVTNPATLPALQLGPAVDSELDGVPQANAMGDDANVLVDDEDGVTMTSGGADFGTIALMGGVPTNITVNSNGPGMLDAWVDFNGDGDFTDSNEQIFMGTVLAAGDTALTFTPPVSTTPLFTYARFRVSTAGGLSPTGQAANGEVEDYLLQINPVPASGVVIPPMGAAANIIEGNNSAFGFAGLPNTTVNFTMGGSASLMMPGGGGDYAYMGIDSTGTATATTFNPATGMGTIQLDSTGAATLRIFSILDGATEGNETVTVTVGALPTATLTIMDPPTQNVAISVAPAQVTEGVTATGGVLRYTFNGGAALANQLAYFAVTGTATVMTPSNPTGDYAYSGATSFNGQAGTIMLDGSGMATFTVYTLSDTVVESTETVTVTTIGSVAPSNTATGTIIDPSGFSVSIGVVPPSFLPAVEETGQFQYTFTGPAGATVNFQVTGTATLMTPANPNGDYAYSNNLAGFLTGPPTGPLQGSIVLPGGTGMTSITWTVFALADGLTEGFESVTVTVLGNSLASGTATGAIVANST